MIGAALYSAVIAFLLGLLMRFAMLRRERESSSTGRPILCFTVLPYVSAVASIGFLVVGIYQWFEPRNHQYPGNLIFLSYIPAAIGFLGIFYSIHLAQYCVTLEDRSIRVTGWPLSDRVYELDKLESIKEEEHKSVLRFSNGQSVALYESMSGYVGFMQRLSANKASKPTPQSGAA